MTIVIGRAGEEGMAVPLKMREKKIQIKMACLLLTCGLEALEEWHTASSGKTGTAGKEHNNLLIE